MVPSRTRLLLPVLALFLPVLAAPSERTLYEGKSAFNDYIGVTEDEAGLRTLSFERHGARQSVVKPGDPGHLELAYAPVALTGLALCDQVRRVLVVGVGGGSIPMFLRMKFPAATIDAVEIDPEVVRVAKKFMGLREDARLRVHTADGRRFIEKCRRPYDIIFLDAFGQDGIPRRLATVEFLRSVSRALPQRGVVVSNIWGRGVNRQYDAMIRTYQEVFRQFCIVGMRDAGNKILIASQRTEPITRAGFETRAADLGRGKEFKFDLRELVAWGFESSPPKEMALAPLTDAPAPAPAAKR